MGGGGSDTTITETTYSYDPVFTGALAKLANEQGEMGRDRWNYYKRTFQPYEEEMVRFNRSMMPMIESLTQATINEQISDLEKNVPIKDALRDAQMESIEGTRELEAEIRKEAMKPEEERIAEARGLARADMQSAFGQQEKELARQMGRFGLDPSSMQTSDALRKTSLGKAAALAGADTMATRQAKETGFQRLAQAQQLMRGQGLAGIQSFQGGGQYSQGNYGLQNPLGMAAQFYQGASGGMSSLANRQTGSTSTQTAPSQDSGFGGILGGVAGSFLGPLGGMAGSALGGALGF